MAETIEARVIQKIATASEWATSDLVPYKGEVMLVSDSSGKVLNIKIGDGVNMFPDLNYMFDSIQQNVNYIPYEATHASAMGFTLVGEGAYANGIVVDANMWAVLYWDGAVWTEIGSYDLPTVEVYNTPGYSDDYASSQKLTTDSRYLDKYEDLTSEAISGTATVFPVGSDLIITEPTANKYAKIEAKYGDRFRIISTGGSSNRSWALIGYDNKVIKSSASGSVNEIVEADPFTQYIVVNNLNTSDYLEILKLNSLNEELINNSNKISDIEKVDDITTWDFNDTVASQWYRSNDDILKEDFTGNNRYLSRGVAIVCQENDLFMINTVSSTNRRAYFFVNENDEVLSYPSTFGNNINNPIFALAPKGTAKVYINLINTDGFNNTTVSKGFKVIKINNYINQNDFRLKKYITLLNIIGKCYVTELKYNTIYNTNQLTINDSTDRIYDANLSSVKIDCEEGDIFIIGGVGGHAGRLYCFASGASLFQQEPQYKAVSNASFVNDPAVLVAPQYATALYVNIRIDNIKNIVKISKTLYDIIKISLDQAVVDVDAKVDSAIDIANEALQVANDASKDVNYISYNVGSGFDWFYYNCVNRADYMLSREILSAKANKMIGDNIVNLKTVDNTNGGSIFFMHDSSIQYYPLDASNGRVYCFTLANDVDIGDSATYINAYVTLISITANSSGVFNTSTYNKIDIARHGDVIDGVTVKLGVGVPNCYLVGDILHMIYSAQGTDDIWYEFHSEYNCLTNVLSPGIKCTIGGDTMTCSKIASYIGQTDNQMISINASIAELNGWYYACVCSQTFFKKGIIIRTQNFKDWEFVVEPDIQIDSNAQFEGAMGAMGGNLFLALRQLNSDYLIFLKMDAIGNILDEKVIPSNPSRPWFFMRGTTELHLCFSTNSFGTSTRLNSVIMHVDSSRLDRSIPKQDIPLYGNYVCVTPRTSNLQFISFTQGTTGVRLSSMNYGQKTSQDVMTAVMNAITI